MLITHSIALEQCRLEDLKALREISISTFDQAYRHLNDSVNFDAYLEQAFSRQQLLEEMQNPISYFYFLRNTEGIVAYIKLNLPGLPGEYYDPKALHLERIYVRYPYQDRGIGCMLLKQVYDIARQMHLDRIWLGVWQHNLKAKAFYEKQGFVKMGACKFLLGNELQEDDIMVKQI